MYFDKCSTVEEVKSRYRTLSKRFHPDLGGDKELMQELNQEYEKYLNNFNFSNFSKTFQRNEHFNKNYNKNYEKSSQQKINAVIRWARSRKWFDTEFVESLQEKLDEYGELTSAQEEGLDNIIKKFKIKLEAYD